MSSAQFKPGIFENAKGGLQNQSGDDNPDCQVAWKAIGKLVESSGEIDEITVSDECGVPTNALAAMTIDAGAANTIHHAAIVRDSFVKLGVQRANADFNKWNRDGLSGPAGSC